MFALFVFVIIFVLSIILLIISRSFVNKAVKRLISFIATAVIILSVSSVYIDLVAYIEGGVTAEGTVLIKETIITKHFDYFVVNDKFWGVGSDFRTTAMLSSRSPTNTSIRYMSIDDICDYPVKVYYLPVSKCVIKMEVALTEGYSEINNFNFYSNGYSDDENKIMSIIAVLSFIILLVVVIKKITEKA